MRRGVFLVLIAAVVAGMWALRRQDADRKPTTGLEVIVVGLDGAHLGLLSPLLEASRLKNLRAFLSRASLGIMSSPVHEGFTSPALWTSMVTGREPYDHGITHFVLPDPTTCQDVAAASGHRLVPALWNMLSDARIRSAFVGLWATWPAEEIRGAMVTDHVTYSRMRLSRTFRGDFDRAVEYDYDTTERNVWPAELEEGVLRLVRLPDDVTAADLRRFVPDLSDAEVEEILRGTYAGSFNQGDADPFQELKVTLQSDRSYAAIGHFVRERVDPALTWVYLEGIDVIEHRFWQYHDPAFPRDVGPSRERLSGVLGRYVEFTDELVGPYLAQADEDTVVIVVSDHGYATVRDPRHPTGHWHDGNAVFFAAGGPVLEGRVLAPASVSIYDVTPTILHLLGLPVAEDMPGRVIEEILDPVWLDLHPIEQIPSYGRRDLVPGDILASDVDADFKDRMREIGYLGGAARGEPIDPAHWHKTPCVFGRLATPCDVELGRAVFTSDGLEGVRPARVPLPRCAIFRDEDGTEHPVVVIQMEEAGGVTRVGFRFLAGDPAGTTLDRIELLDGPDERFLDPAARGGGG